MASKKPLQKQQRQTVPIDPKKHDCIPPKGARFGVVVGTIMSSANADGQSTLRALHESLLWCRKDAFEKQAGLGVEEIINKLRPSITPFVWEYRT